MPLTHEIKELNTVFVHGGFLPDIPWNEQNAVIVTEVQVIDADGRPCKRREAPDALPWADHWTGPPFVVYGHTPRAEVYKLKWSICLDTGCAMGGQLSAFILPERRVVQVKARRRYYPLGMEPERRCVLRDVIHPTCFNSGMPTCSRPSTDSPNG